MEHTIQEVARLAGVTSRTLRHYDQLGLVAPSSVGAGGIRRYDADALVRLQRVLLLRELGLGLPAIAEVLAGETRDVHALRAHRAWLEQERERLARQLTSVEATIDALEGGEEPMAEQMFDGFDHTQYRDEVTERWGADAYARSDAWWRGKSADEKREWRQQLEALSADWIAAAASGVAPDSAAAQELARRHVAWLAGIPGTPGALKEYVTGLGDMYVADPRFAAHYGGAAGATFVRDALSAYARARL
ncbi:MerR family transcriptional regulator [Protaetiibacter intestinalis]|uniref:MerR family transcriptional regulator n=1 Tax=Protaetiibacter intestinalis TaxID=2419774 RepID=A0A387B7E6_9MICO|nr:TipAS antibiotic-recognition domain-containing protein [Protaetiibacter intestinalis]AYF97701.1 MerR family transcriptional regulator [Protaetiibacter intestinalis]